MENQDIPPKYVEMYAQLSVVINELKRTNDNIEKIDKKHVLLEERMVDAEKHIESFHGKLVGYCASGAIIGVVIGFVLEWRMGN